MTILFFVITIMVAIVIHFLVAYYVSEVVLKKGYTIQETHAFAKCFFLGIGGYIYVLALPDRNIKKQNKEIITELKQIQKVLGQNVDDE